MGLTKVNHGMTKLPFSNRNKIINGNFDIWQRGTSQTIVGYGSADRWICRNAGTTKTASQQTFALGQTDVPGNPKYFMRHVVTSVAGASNFCNISQPIENVSTLSGKTATLSFYAKAEAPKNIVISFNQNFGTGGSPSESILGIEDQLIYLTTSWKKYVIVVDIPSISGKVLGTDNNSYLQILFWFDAGSNFASRTANLGQQSGTFDIAQVQLEEGEIATPFEDRPITEELALCQRYYQVFGKSAHSVGVQGYTLAASNVSCTVVYPVVMRATPTITAPTWNNLNTVGAVCNAPNNSCFLLAATATATGVVSSINTSAEPFKLDAEL